MLSTQWLLRIVRKLCFKEKRLSHGEDRLWARSWRMGGNWLSGKESSWFFSRGHEPRDRGACAGCVWRTGVSQLEWTAGSRQANEKTEADSEEQRCQAKAFKLYTWGEWRHGMFLPPGETLHVAASVCEPQVLMSCAVSTASEVWLQGA